MKPLLSPDTVKTYKKEKCRYCDTTLVQPFLNLGELPLANAFLTDEQAKKDEFRCPLALCFCAKCGLVQLSHVVPPKMMFSNYLYVSSTTKTFQTHFSEYAIAVRKKLKVKREALAVDIGSNDGFLLKCYQQEGLKSVGVEPAKNLSETANTQGLETVNSYFNSESVKTIIQKHGRAEVISGNNVFAHINDIATVCECVNQLLREDGFFVIEFPYLVTMVKELLFDMVYHEHLSYITLTALRHVLDRFNLGIFDLDHVSSHGGSLRVYIQKRGGPYPASPKVGQCLEDERQSGYLLFETYQKFAKRIHRVREIMLKFVNDIKSEGKTISGYGAPAKGNTLISFCGFTDKEIEFIVEDNPLKQNLLTPGSRIPVVSRAHLMENTTDYVILFAWNFAPEILKKLDPLAKKGVKFIIPLPKPHIV
jgi:SAM-dependent methyltransferase